MPRAIEYVPPGWRIWDGLSRLRGNCESGGQYVLCVEAGIKSQCQQSVVEHRCGSNLGGPGLMRPLSIAVLQAGMLDSSRFRVCRFHIEYAGGKTLRPI